MFIGFSSHLGHKLEKKNNVFKELKLEVIGINIVDSRKNVLPKTSRKRRAHHIIIIVVIGKAQRTLGNSTTLFFLQRDLSKRKPSSPARYFIVCFISSCKHV